MISPRKLTILLVALFVFSTGCGNCKSDTDGLPRAADAQLTALSQALPDSADAAIIIPDLGQMRSSLNIALERISVYQPGIRMMEQQLARELGVKITDEESWKNAGIATDSALIVAFVGQRPILVTNIDDREKFETRFIERMRSFAQIESPIRNETVAGHQFKVSGDQAGTDMAWSYDGSMVILAMPPFNSMGVFKDGSALTIASQIASGQVDQSLGKSTAFTDFRKGLGDHYPLSFFINAQQYFQREESLNLGGLDSLIEGLSAWTESNADGAGVALNATPSRLEVRAFISGDEGLLEQARGAYANKVDTDWDGMLTENTVLALRTGFDLQKAYQTYVETLPDEERRALRRDLTQYGRAHDLDFEEDVIAAFSGHSMLTFYGIGGNVTQLLGVMTPGADTGDIIRTLLSNAGLMANFHFTDQEKLDTLLNRFEQAGGELLQRRALIADGEEVDGIEVFEPRSLNLFPGRLFHKDTSVTIAAAGIGENSVHQYLTNSRDDVSLHDSERFALGKQFAEADTFNGLYLNFDNLRTNMRRFPMISGFANQLQPFHEALIDGGIDDHGFYASVIVDFTDPLELSPENTEPGE